MITWWREIVIAVLLGLLGLQTVRLAGEESEHFKTKTAHAVQLQRLADNARDVATKAQQFQTALQQAVAAVDAAKTKERDDALADNARLRAGDRPGRLRIAAACPRPAAPDGVPGTTPAARVDDVATVELAPAARSDVWDLRAELIEDQAKLRGLQAYVAAGCRAP